MFRVCFYFIGEDRSFPVRFASLGRIQAWRLQKLVKCIECLAPPSAGVEDMYIL